MKLGREPSVEARSQEVPPMRPEERHAAVVRLVIDALEDRSGSVADEIVGVPQVPPVAEKPWVGPWSLVIRSRAECLTAVEEQFELFEQADLGGRGTPEIDARH